MVKHSQQSYKANLIKLRIGHSRLTQWILYQEMLDNQRVVMRKDGKLKKFLNNVGLIEDV